MKFDKKDERISYRYMDFNKVHTNPKSLERLRRLTLCRSSGMNLELDRLSHIITHEKRPVNCKIIGAYYEGKLIGWSLLFKETSGTWYGWRGIKFQPNHGTLFQVYVDPEHRRKGIASAMMQTARKRLKDEKLCIVPHDGGSRAFFTKNKKDSDIVF